MELQINLIIGLNRAAVTNYRRLGGLNNRRLFLMVLEAGKSKIKAPADLVSGEGLLPRFADGHLLIVSSHNQKSRQGGQALVSLLRALILFMRAPPS